MLQLQQNICMGSIYLETFDSESSHITTEHCINVNSVLHPMTGLQPEAIFEQSCSCKIYAVDIQHLIYNI